MAAAAVPAAKLEDAEALIDSVETFIFDCDGETDRLITPGLLGVGQSFLDLTGSPFAVVAAGRRGDLEG